MVRFRIFWYNLKMVNLTKKIAQTQTLKKFFIDNLSEEFILGHIFHKVNTKLPDSKKFQNNKALGRAINVLKKTELVIEKRGISLRTDPSKTHYVMFYKCMGWK